MLRRFRLIFIAKQTNCSHISHRSRVISWTQWKFVARLAPSSGHRPKFPFFFSLGFFSFFFPRDRKRAAESISRSRLLRSSQNIRSEQPMPDTVALCLLADVFAVCDCSSSSLSLSLSLSFSLFSSLSLFLPLSLTLKSRFEVLSRVLSSFSRCRFHNGPFSHFGATAAAALASNDEPCLAY